MENVAYVALSHQTALERQMAVTANNVANMSTPAFKAQDILFNEYLVEPKKSDDISMVSDFATFRRTQQGPMQTTGNPLDLALQGNGYFVIETADGQQYTRAGNFALNDKAELVTQNGRIVLSDSGPLVVPPGDTQLVISKDGTVSTHESGVLGRLQLASFENDQELLEVGDGLYKAEGLKVLPAENTTIHQSMLEGSNVEPIKEMNRMIEISRAYQSAQRLLQTDHDRQRNVISRLTSPE